MMPEAKYIGRVANSCLQQGGALLMATGGPGGRSVGRSVGRGTLGGGEQRTALHSVYVIELHNGNDRRVADPL